MHKITSVKIEAPIKRIYSAAFYHCCALESIVIPKSVENIDGHAFSMYKGYVNVARTAPFLVVFEKGTRIKRIEGRVFEVQENETIIILPVRELPYIGNELFVSSTGNIVIYAYKKGLNVGGILTKKIETGSIDRLYTCLTKKSSINVFLFLTISCHCS